MSSLDNLKKAWQSQKHGELKTDPKKLLVMVRMERYTYLASDIFVILVLFGVSAFFIAAAMSEIQESWPWFIAAFCCMWVVATMTYRRVFRKKHKLGSDHSIAEHIDLTIKELKEQAKLQKSVFWWYILPLALGCMLPPAISYALSPDPFSMGNLLDLVFSQLFFFIVFFFVFLVCRFAGVKTKANQINELEKLKKTFEEGENA